jgi:glycolate oxidase FAD binding subunit
MTEAEGLHQINVWGGQPLPISASCWHQGQLSVRLSGARAAVDAAIFKMGGEVLADADNFWDQLREHQMDFFAESTEGLWRVSVPSTTPVLQLPGDTLTEWGGAQRWLKTTADATTIRAAAEAAGGHATLFRGGDKSVGVFQPPKAPVADIHRRLKASFDPAGIFNPHRMYPDF